MALRCIPALLAAVMLALAAAPAAPAAGPELSRCSAASDRFRCGTLSVPLDRTGGVPGTVRLRFAVSSGGSRRPLLIALSGGPGQPSIGAADSFATSLRPMLRRYRLAVLDQRGTGSSGLLRCPSVERLRSLDPFTPRDVAACGQLLGPRRAFYTTADTVLDLDALREALGAPKLALMGISYGTHVALQYARAFPDRVDRLVLDSIVGPQGPDPFLMDSYRALPRVLREQCASSRCRGITDDPVADVAALVRRLAVGPVRGRGFDRRGRAVTITYHSEEELPFLLMEGDLNPYLQAALPAALAAARRGDDAPVLRLRAIAEGPRTDPHDLSFGLNVTTGCTDGATPYPLSMPPSERRAAGEAALAAYPPTDYAPFDAPTVFATGYGDDCLDWPQDNPRPPFTGPLPDVPALLLGGGADLRTPFENAIATAAQLPHSTLVRVAGTGHDEVDSDLTGCTQTALTRFTQDKPVGDPCHGKTNIVRPVPRPPRSLREFRSAPGVGGDRGRELFAVLDTVEDVRLTALQRIFAGLDLNAGGLRGGSMAGSNDSDAVRLDRYTLLTGVPVTGTVRLGERNPLGTLRIGGRLGGTLRLLKGGVTRGTLGGRSVRFDPSRGALAAAVRDGGASPWRLRGVSPDRAEQQLRRQGLRR